MTQINELSAVDVIAVGDQFPIYSAANGDTRRAALSILAAYISMQLSNGGLATTTIMNGGVKWTVGIGSPEGIIVAPIGSIYSRTDGGASTTLYVKQSGAGTTGWVAK